MNAIILTATWGVIMMFGGVFFKARNTPKYWAIAGLVVMIIANYLELKTGEPFTFRTGEPLFALEVRNMVSFNSFNLTFTHASSLDGLSADQQTILNSLETN